MLVSDKCILDCVSLPGYDNYFDSNILVSDKDI